MVRAPRLLILLSAIVSLAGVASCAPSLPPFTQPAGPPATRAAAEASVVFLWPETSCDPPGYFTLATADGHFLGNLARGSRLAASLPAGENTIFGWNEVMESAAGGWMRKETTPVVHVDLLPGRTYYVHLLLGDWDERGPVVRWAHATRGRYPIRVCSRVPDSATSAMVAVSPRTVEWESLSAWVADLQPTESDRAAGQMWLGENREIVEAHRAVAEDRFAALRPAARALATITPADGAP